MGTHIIEKEIATFKCAQKKCKHEWIPYDSKRPPTKCPKCQSFKWMGEGVEKPVIVMRRVEKFHCLQCEHEWMPRRDIKEPSRQCPRCTSRNWDRKPRIRYEEVENG